MRDMPSGFAVKGLVGAILGGVFGLAAVASIAVFAALHFRRRRRAAAAEREAAEATRELPHGRPAIWAVEKARASSSGGTTNGDREMRRITPPAVAVDAKAAAKAVRSRGASLVDASPGEREPGRSVSPVSDIAVETAPPRTGGAAALATNGSAATKPVRAAST
jgi:hypothetical protein